MLTPPEILVSRGGISPLIVSPLRQIAGTRGMVVVPRENHDIRSPVVVVTTNRTEHGMGSPRTWLGFPVSPIIDIHRAMLT